MNSLSTSMLIIVIVIASAILLSIFLYLLLCRLLQTTSSVNNNTETMSDNSSEATSVNNSTLANTNNGLLNALPSFLFSSLRSRTSSTIVGDCAICLVTFQGHERLRLLPRCCHVFHVECIEIWLLQNASCPICRARMPLAESELLGVLGNLRNGRFQLELGSVSRSSNSGEGQGNRGSHRSYSLGSVEYVLEDEEAEVTLSDLETDFRVVEDSRIGDVDRGGENLSESEFSEAFRWVSAV